MRYIITGITSFLGWNLAENLLLQGHEVTGVVRPDSRQKDKLDRPGLAGLKVIECSLRDIRESVKDGSGFDVCIHLAWGGVGSAGRSDPEIQKKNIENSKIVFLTAASLGCTAFFFAGSQAEYGGGTHNCPGPVSEYGKAKLAFGLWAKEQSALSSQMRFIHLRIFSIYGWGDHPTSLVNTVIQAALAGKEISLGACDQIWNYMEIRDCADAIRVLSEKNVPAGVYDIAGYENRALKEYVMRINTLCGGGAKLLFGTRGNNAEGRQDMDPDITGLAKAGFVERIPFDEGIVHLIRKIKEQD